MPASWRQSPSIVSSGEQGTKLVLPLSTACTSPCILGNHSEPLHMHSHRSAGSQGAAAPLLTTAPCFPLLCCKPDPGLAARPQIHHAHRGLACAGMASACVMQAWQTPGGRSSPVRAQVRLQSSSARAQVRLPVHPRHLSAHPAAAPPYSPCSAAALTEGMGRSWPWSGWKLPLGRAAIPGTTHAEAATLPPRMTCRRVIVDAPGMCCRPPLADKHMSRAAPLRVKAN